MNKSGNKKKTVLKAALDLFGAVAMTHQWSENVNGILKIKVEKFQICLSRLTALTF